MKKTNNIESIHTIDTAMSMTAIVSALERYGIIGANEIKQTGKLFGKSIRALANTIMIGPWTGKCPDGWIREGNEIVCDSADTEALDNMARVLTIVTTFMAESAMAFAPPLNGRKFHIAVSNDMLYFFDDTTFVPIWRTSKIVSKEIHANGFVRVVTSSKHAYLLCPAT